VVVNHEDIVFLAREIGPRLPGSIQERRAGQFVAERLGELGIPSTLLPMRTPRTFVPTYVVLFAMVMAGIALAWWVPYLGVAVSLVGVALLALEVSTRPVLTRFMGTHRGNNVLGLIPARQTHGDEEPDLRVIISAHLDTAKSGILSKQPLVRWFRPLLIAVFVSAGLVPILLLVYALSGWMYAWWLTFVPGLLLVVGIIVLLERELRGRPVRGANDNASGVAATLGVATALQRDHPTRVESWVLMTSGQEAGQAGMRRFLSDNHFNRDTTYFINIDNVGAGHIRFTDAEGVIFALQSSPELVRLAGEVAQMHPEWQMRGTVHRLLPTDQFVALARGYQSISILAYDAEGNLPNWHQVSDTVDNIQLTTVQTAADLALGIIRRLDAEIIAKQTARIEDRDSPEEAGLARDDLARQTQADER